MDDHDKEKRREQNLFVRGGKSESEVTNRRLPSTVCLKKTGPLRLI